MDGTVAGQCQVFGGNGFGMRLGLTGHPTATAADEIADERGLPIAPDARSGRQRISLGQHVQQFQQHRVAIEGIDNRADRRGILQIAPGGHVRQQQMVSHHRGQQFDVGGPQAQSLPHPGGQFSADDAVVTTAPLAQVVQQRTQQQQIGAGNPGAECACARDGFDEVAIDGPNVHRVPGRQIPHHPPLREEPTPQPGAVQGLDGGGCGGPGREQHQQVLQRLPGPRGTQLRRGVGQPPQRGGGDRQAGRRRRGGHPQGQARVALRSGVAGEDHLAAVLHHAFVERTAHRPSQRGQATARQRIRRDAHTGVDVIADGARGVRERAGQVEAIADTQGRADLVGILREKLVASAPRRPVQFGPDIHQRQVGSAERTGRRIRREAGVDIGQLRDRQCVEQLDVPKSAHAGLEVRFGPVGDLAGARPARPALLDQLVVAGNDSRPPLPPRTAGQSCGQVLVTGDETAFQHRQPGGHVRTGDLKSL